MIRCALEACIEGKYIMLLFFLKSVSLISIFVSDEMFTTCKYTCHIINDTALYILYYSTYIYIDIHM